jgi:hypothetical protein
MESDENSFIGKMLRQIQAGISELRQQNVAFAHALVSVQKDIGLVYKRMGEMQRSIDEMHIETRETRSAINILAITSDDHNVRLTRIEEMFLSRPH